VTFRGYQQHCTRFF